MLLIGMTTSTEIKNLVLFPIPLRRPEQSVEKFYRRPPTQPPVRPRRVQQYPARLVRLARPVLEFAREMSQLFQDHEHFVDAVLLARTGVEDARHSALDCFDIC